MLHESIIKKSVPNKGFGLFASKPISIDEIIWELDGSCKIFPLNDEIRQKYPHGYQFGHNYVHCHDDSEYMNHSCDPNAWWESDQKLSARRDIKAGEEITYDYSTTDISYEWTAPWECKCGSMNCRKRITNKDCLDKHFQRKYGKHLPSWTKEFIRNYDLENRPLKNTADTC